MSYPNALVEYLKSLPFLGSATVSESVVEAGASLELRVTYTVGASGLADGAWLKLAFKFYSDWGLFQTSDPKASNYLSVEYLPREPFPGESPSTVRELKVRFDQKGHERPYQKAVIVDVVDGYLKPGDKVLLRLGDRRAGGPGTRAQTFVEEAFRFRLFVDHVGASRFAPVPGDLLLRIVSGKAARSVLLAPRLARPGVPLPLVWRVEDRWGNAVTSETAPPALRVSHDNGQPLSPEAPLSWGDNTRTWARTELVLPAAGEFRVEAGDETVWIEADPAAPFDRALYADLHIHSEDTVGVNTTLAVMSYARDAAALDIAGYTANDFNVRADRWDRAVAICRSLHVEKRFLCFPGTEWCGASAVGGDRNVIFLGDEVRFPLDRDGRSLRVFDWNEDTAPKKELTSDVSTAQGLHGAYRDLATDDRVLLIPHVGGRRALFDWHDGALERLVEIASSWGHFDWFYREALSRGLQVGASAAGDEHRGRPGGGAPGVGSFGVYGGLTGVVSGELTSSSVGRALRARHTWATTGTRAVALLHSGNATQGDCIETGTTLEISYELYAQQGWESVELRDGQSETILLKRDLDIELGLSSTRVRIRWGGARIKDRYRWAAWRLRLEVTHSDVQAWETRGFEHLEETAIQKAPGLFEIRTDTYGDADSLELTLSDLAASRFTLRYEIDAFNKTGDALARNPDQIAPRGLWTFTGLDLLENPRLLRELGGAELFVAAERLSDSVLPRVVKGSLYLDPPISPEATSAVYLFARERDDSKVWTSPLFVRRPA